MQTTHQTESAPVQVRGEKEKMLDALSIFIRQRPGLEFGNYGDRKAYSAELREITKTRHQAFELLAFVSRSSITSEDIKQNARHRLEWMDGAWDYTTCQYFPVEYRRAACSMLSATAWDYFREKCGCDTREKIQQAARRTSRGPLQIGGSNDPLLHLFQGRIIHHLLRNTRPRRSVEDVARGDAIHNKKGKMEK